MFIDNRNVILSSAAFFSSLFFSFLFFLYFSLIINLNAEFMTYCVQIRIFAMGTHSICMLNCLVRIFTSVRSDEGSASDSGQLG